MNNKNKKSNPATTILAVLLFVGIAGAAVYITNSDPAQATTTPADSTTNAVANTESSAYSGASAYGSASPETAQPTTTEAPKTETPKPEVTTTTTAKPVETPKPVAEVKPEPKPVAATPTPSYTTTATAPAKKAEPRRAVESSLVKKTSATRSTRNETTVVKSGSSSKAEKLLTDEELKSMVAQVVEKGDENALYLKCVQLLKVQNANNTKAAEQVETYVRSKGYSIAGRETTSKSAKGLVVSPGNGCMRITIGSF